MVDYVICFFLSLTSLTLTSELYPYLDRDAIPTHEAPGGFESFEVAQQNSVTSPPAVKIFTDDIAGSNPHRFAYGHMAVVSNPRDTLSIYEPSGNDSCTAQPWTKQRLLTKTAANHNCIYATNGGFFNTTTGNCLGNMVSEGRLVVNGRGIMNPNFGVLKNGTIVVGYLSEEHVLGWEFQTLVQGIIWLVRDSKNHVQESIEIESGDMQTTGNLEGFVSVVSARTAIGHDKEGNVLLLHVEGKTWSRGINLREFADLLVTHGFVNAVNLDGGSSATVAYNTTLINYPSEHCPTEGGAYRCERALSSILCVHAECTCEHGTCVHNVCECEEGWQGATCSDPITCPLDCSEHGVCTAQGCLCNPGYLGSGCQVTCPEGSFGEECGRECNCVYGSCDAVHGACTCFAGWTGVNCNTPCPNNTWGRECKQACTACSEHGVCDPKTGECLCAASWQGKICQVYRGTYHFINGLPSRDFGILAVLIALVAIVLVSMSVNVYYCLKYKNYKKSRRSRGGTSSRNHNTNSTSRSPKLPSVSLSPLEHTKRQIPIFRELQNGGGQHAGREVLEMQVTNGGGQHTGREVLEMIERVQNEQDSEGSDVGDTTALLKT
eukprot:sb/3463161/